MQRGGGGNRGGGGGMFRGNGGPRPPWMDRSGPGHRSMMLGGGFPSPGSPMRGMKSRGSPFRGAAGYRGRGRGGGSGW